jgi:CBS domain-containing protein
MRVRDVMDIRCARLGAQTSMQAAAELLAISRANDLAVVDEEGNFMGVLAEGDLIRAVMPDVNEVVAAGGSHQDAFRLFLKTGRGLAYEPITRLIITNPILVAPDDELMTVATVMIAKGIRTLHVVENGKLCGSVSRADLCWGLYCHEQGRK